MAPCIRKLGTVWRISVQFTPAALPAVCSRKHAVRARSSNGAVNSSGRGLRAVLVA